jgi:hypothetical protein
MVNKQAALDAVRNYLARHPEEALRLLKNVFLLRVGVPLDAFRWIASQASGSRAPRDVQIEAVPPGIRVGATLDLMGATLRASAVIYVEDVRLNSLELRFELRLAEVALKVLSGGDSPVAALLNSGALDLSKPGNLAAHMPKRPAMLVEAKDDRIAIDLMKHPALQNQKAEMVIGMVTPFVSIGAIRTEWEHLDIVLRPFQQGVQNAVNAVKAVL